MGATVKIYGRGSDSLPQEQVNGSRGGWGEKIP